MHTLTLDHDLTPLQKKRIEQASRDAHVGRLVPDAKVEAWLNSLGSLTPLKAPKAK